MRKLIVGSNSPRRQELMKQVGFDFKVERLDVDEVIDGHWLPISVAEKLAILKNTAYRVCFENEVILTADTVVINEGEVLGKPKDTQEAFDMINSMQGKTHRVVSAVCISSQDKVVSFSDVVEVEMMSLTEQEILHYVKTYKPLDKAGAYGIQEWIGMIGVSSIKGSFYSVVGMPIHLVYQSLIRDFGISPL
ncbi:MAG: Maf family nucleotide pyrophosphatase [Reichenbachiella sp.]